MSNIAKSIIISLVIGIAAFLLIGVIHFQTLRIPNNMHHAIDLLVGIGAVLAGCLWLNGWGSSSSSSNSSRPAATTASSSDGRETGSVKWFNVKKGYGFITRDSGDDVFVHFRNLSSGRRSISDGQRVSFVVTNGDKGLQADEVDAIS